jgi:hypothetical protein
MQSLCTGQEYISAPSVTIAYFFGRYALLQSNHQAKTASDSLTNQTICLKHKRRGFR